jgi:purine-nucleoside phosphorylase
MKLLGVETLILTNACGAVNRNFKPGELMVIKDHINLTANNPLIGSNVDFFGPRFPDASEIYTKNLRDLAKKVAEKNNIKLNEGVYTWWTGPSYETPAEIKMISVLGGDAVGMSTVPEALVASHAGMNVLGISCLTNMASGILPQKLSHQEVLDVAKQVRASFSQLIKDILVDISTSK